MSATAYFPAGSTSTRDTVTTARSSKASPSLWTVISQALEMAHVVGESGPVSARQLQQVKKLASRL